MPGCIKLPSNGADTGPGLNTCNHRKFQGVKITPLENSVPSGVSPFADLVYGMLPHPKITEILEEVDSWTGFTRHFAHLKNNNVRPKDGRLLLTTILADGINLGLTKMA